MEKTEDDYIPTPSTSRSNSFDEGDERPSLPPPLPPTEETGQSESTPLRKSKICKFISYYSYRKFSLLSGNLEENSSGSVANQIRATIAAKRATFISSSSSSESESEVENDFVDVNKNDLAQDSSTSINAVSLLTG